jgi:acyl carrier protein
MNATHDIVTGWLSMLPTQGKAAIEAETDLIDTGILDSIAVLDLISFLEDRFQVTVPIEDFIPENFRSSAAISSLVTRLVESGS